jgi:filamentous hemagglutinin family protein
MSNELARYSREIAVACLQLISCGAVFLFLADVSLAQVNPDNTLGTNSSTVNPDGGPSVVIGGGATSGNNLFHSFSDFNVGEGATVYFANPVSISNIIARITGSKPSKILGTLGVLGDANLFLLNPNGIIFGKNAQLDLKGSFIATTADTIEFDKVFEFSASNPHPPPLLTVNIPPTGLRFGRVSGPIINRSTTGLSIESGRTIALIGKYISMEGGIITAPSANVELGSVDNNSFISLSSTALGFTFEYGDALLQDIKFSKGALIDISGENGGNIRMKGRNILIKENSSLVALNTGSSSGGNITINASEALLLDNSGLFSGSLDQATGPAGNIDITSKNLFVRRGSFIDTSSDGSGQGGNLIIDASDSVEVSGESQLSTQALGNGNAGDLYLSTKKLFVLDGGQLTSSTDGNGNGGNLNIFASDQVIIDGSLSPSGVFSISSGKGTGNGGSINIKTRKIVVKDDGKISVGSQGSGAAGNLAINAHSVLLNDGFLDATTTGGQGNIQLNSNSVILRNNSRISTSANGLANGGNITIDTGVLLGLGNSDIVANALNGNGGRIDVTAKGIFGFTPLTREQLLQLSGTTDPIQLLSSDITAISQANPSLNGQVNLNTTAPDPNEGLVELPTNVVDPRDLVAQNACRRGTESEFTTSGRGGLPVNPNQDLSNASAQVGLVEPTTTQTSTQTQKQSPAASATPQQTTKQSIAPAQGWVYNEKGEIVLVAYNPSVTSPQRLKDNTACAGQ